MTTKRPGTYVWHLKWQGDCLTGPDGGVRGPVYGGRPDPEIAHELIDRWAVEMDLPRRFPHLHDWSLWWHFRFRLHASLVSMLPNLRLVLQLKRFMPRGLERIIMDRPPQPWWPSLLQQLFPGAAVETHGAPKVTKRMKLARHALRVRRAWRASRNLRRVLEDAAARPSVLVLSRDRVWSGQEDLELGTAMKALREVGLCPIVMARATACGPAVTKYALRTRPANHLFDDYVAFSYLFRHGWPQVPSLNLACAELPAEGLDLAPLCTHLLQSTFAEAYRESVMYCQCVDGLVAKIQPRAVLLTDENNGNYALRLGLKLAGVPTVAVQHGVIHANHMSYCFPPGVAPSGIPLSDKTCVYGPWYKDLLANQSIYPESSIVVTGQPQMDARTEVARRAWRQRTAQGERLREKTLPPHADRLLLFSSQHAFRTSTAPLLLRAMAQCGKGSFLVIRPHPMEAPQPFWDDAIRMYGAEGRALVQREGTLDAWLDACDVHISATSTTLSEAAVFGRPNIVVLARELGDWTGCLAAGVGVALDDFPSLAAALDYWLKEPEDKREEHESKRRAYIENHFYRLDGGAGKRIAEVVKEVSETTRK